MSTVKYGRDYTVCKIKATESFTNAYLTDCCGANYELFGQGHYNDRYYAYYAEDRNEALKIARKIMYEWEIKS